MNQNELKIYENIKKAIIKQQLKPNIQLVERDIAEAFGVSRAPVRNVLKKLAYERLVTIIKNKGAFVSAFSKEDAEEVFEMRRILEIEAVKKACRLRTSQQLNHLGAVIEQEIALKEKMDPYDIVCMYGDFHLELAALSQNSYLKQYLTDLTSITNVIVGIYGGEQQQCTHHGDILAAIERQDEKRAIQLVIEHLDEIESSLKFHDDKEPLSLVDIFKN